MTIAWFLGGVLLGVVLRTAWAVRPSPEYPITFADDASATAWQRLVAMDDLVLVPMPRTTAAGRARRLDWISAGRRSGAVFLHVATLPRSSRAEPLRIAIRAEHEGFVICADRAVTVADAITRIAIELGVRAIRMGCSERPTGWFSRHDVGACVAERIADLRSRRISERRVAAARFARERRRMERDVLRQLVVGDGAPNRIAALFAGERSCFPASRPLRPLPALTWVA